MRLGVDIGGLGSSNSGVARYLYGIIESIVTDDVAVDVRLYSNRPSSVPLVPGNFCLCVDDAYARVPYSYWLRHRLPDLLARDRVDVLWGQGHFLPLTTRHRCLRVLTIHDLTAMLYPRTMARRARVGARASIRRVVRSADLILADSLATMRLLHALMPEDAGKACVIYPGLGAGICRLPQQDAAAEVASRFGLSGDFILTVGNLEPRKDHGTLLDAVNRLPDSPLLVVAGSVGWRCRDIVRGIRASELAGRVRFLGRVTDAGLSALYSAASLMVYPSYYEGFGLPVLEAMACGCPVICCRSSSLPEVGGDAVCYFRPHDAADLARVLRQVMGGAELRSEMRRRGLVRAARFGQATAGSRLSAVLRSVVAERRGQSAGGSDPAVSRAGGPAWQ